jgi:hypothetical protein
MKKTRSKKSSTDVARERVKAQFAPKVPCKNVDAEGFCTGTCAGSLCCKCADYSPRDAAAKAATGETPVVPVEPAAVVANTRERDAAYRLSRQYAKVNGSWKNALEQTVRFGAMLKEWGDFLGEGRGRGKDGEGLKEWLANHCPEINYKTAMGYKLLAEKTVRMLGGGAPAVAALIGRDTVTDPDGNEIPIDAEVVEKKEEIFRAADSRRKLEQMYFDFTEAPARPKGRAKGSKNVPKTDAERADAFWKLNAATLSAPWALKSIPLVEWRVANFALTALQPLVTALKRRVSEGE